MVSSATKLKIDMFVGFVHLLFISCFGPLIIWKKTTHAKKLVASWFVPGVVFFFHGVRSKFACLKLAILKGVVGDMQIVDCLKPNLATTVQPWHLGKFGVSALCT